MPLYMLREIEKLKSKLLFLCARAEESVRRAVRAVKKRDVALAVEVIETDVEVDQIEIDVEEECLKILALYQPVAIDLRLVVAVLKINNDLERIADLSVNIAEQALVLSQGDNGPIPFDFDNMSEKTQTMLRKSLDAMIRMDEQLAREVIVSDEEVDAINRQMYQKVYQEIKKTPERVEVMIRFLSISRSLERIADYATNIAEDILYMIRGEIVRHKPDMKIPPTPSGGPRSPQGE